MNRHRKLGLSGVALVLFLILLELVCRAAFFQRHGRHGLALQDGVDFLRRRCTWARMAREADATRDLRRAYQEAGVLLYQPAGRELLEQFAGEYQTHFAELVSAAGRMPNASAAPSSVAWPPSTGSIFLT
jgi:hypothetical protein